MRIFSLREMFSVFSTWVSHALPTRQTAGAPLSSTAAKPDRSPALAARAARHAEGRKHRMFQLRRACEKGVVIRVRAGPAAFDHIDAQLIQLARDRLLVGNGKIHPRACAPSRSVESYK